MLKQKGYKWCIVPLCTNTSNTSSKLFIHVPKPPELRKKWILACRRNVSDISEKSTVYCCEDHFDMENDMENWMKYKIMGGAIKMKPGDIPHVFQCQPDRKRTIIHAPRPAAAKRLRAELVEQALRAEGRHQNLQLDEAATPSTSEVTSFRRETSPKLVNDPANHTSDVAIQLLPHFRSKSVETKIPMTDTASSPIKSCCVTAPPVEIPMLTLSSNSSEHGSDTSFESGNSNGSDELDGEFRNESTVIRKKEIVNSRVELIIKQRPKVYLGLPEQSAYILDLLTQHTNLDMNHILLTLKKIKLFEPFTILADDFGISPTYASRIFCKAVPKIAQYLKKLIFWPERNKIIELLPMSFRSGYNNVQSIIDCLEIEIEKPSNPVHQALTWSEYKHCNTLKYLISSTPDGLVNFISDGYSGRISDSLLLENCGFLDKLPAGCAVMADRGFKHVEPLLLQKGCTLIRPPSVASGMKVSKEDVMQSKRIASLRIHIERLIRRIREFSMLKPHACVDHNLVPVIDDIIVIASALINLQTPLVRS